MRRPWPALVLFLGGVFLLVSLYLPWQRFSLDLSYFRDQESSAESLLHLFGGSDSLEGWDSSVAPAAALSALLLVGLGVSAWARPDLASRLPLGRSALVAAFFAVAIAFDTRLRAELFSPGSDPDVDVQVAYGAYIAIAAVAAMLVGALILRQADLLRRPSPLDTAAGLLAAGLLIAFLLPWDQFSGMESSKGIATAPAQVAAVLVITAPRVFGLPAALFTVAAFSVTTSWLDRAYGAWIGIGIAAGLTLVSLAGVIRRRPDVERLSWRRLVLGAAALLLVASFFLPWQEEFCAPNQCLFSHNAWTSEAAAAAALLAIALIFGELSRIRRRLPPRAELAAGIAMLVTTLGFQFGHGREFVLAYGFWIGLACTAAIAMLAAIGLGRPPLDARLVPIALCVVYLAVVVPTWWGVASDDSLRTFWFAPFSWITVAGALLALALIQLWVVRTGDARPLFLVPGVIAALAVIDLVRAEANAWGGGVVLGLCGLLGLCALIEQRGGFGELRIPEILRVDRL